MNDLIRIAAVELVRFFSAKLPDLSPDRWQKHVVDFLSFQQQRIVVERNHTKLQQLDFAALLRVPDHVPYARPRRSPLGQLTLCDNAGK